MKTKFGLLGLGVLIGLLLSMAVWQVVARGYTFQGSLIDPPVQAANFELLDQNGNPFRLSDQHGKIVLIFFGYTNCPDVCPVTLSEYKQIKKTLGNISDQVSYLFITVDPERDTPERLKIYLSNFDPGITGLTASRAELESIWKNYGVYQARQETGSAAGYLVDHSARIYAIDKNGNWRLTYPFGMEVKKIIQDLVFLLEE